MKTVSGGQTRSPRTYLRRWPCLERYQRPANCVNPAAQWAPRPVYQRHKKGKPISWQSSSLPACSISFFSSASRPLDQRGEGSQCGRGAEVRPLGVLLSRSGERGGFSIPNIHYRGSFGREKTTQCTPDRAWPSPRDFHIRKWAVRKGTGSKFAVFAR